VGYFKDAQEVYETIGRLHVDLAQDGPLLARYQRANTIVQFVHRNPDAVITTRLVEGSAGRVDLGPTDMEPEIVLTLDADVAHRFWLGRVNATIALARGQIRAKGPVAKLLRLLPAARPIYARYRAQLEAQGRADLIPAD
jgi:hypothetical protein